MLSRALLLAVSLAALLGFHAVSVSPDRLWYNSFWWLDLLMHFIGGVWVAGALVLLLRLQSPSFIIGFTLLVALGWEVLEYAFNTRFFGVHEASFADSLWVLDTLIDVMLAVFAATIVVWWTRRYTKDNV